MAENTKPQGASLSEMFRQMSELLGGESSKFQNAMSAAQAITPIDPSILQGSLAQGGPLSTAQDFATSGAWAMTPEMFRQAMQSRPDVGKQIGEVTSLSDAIFGRSNQRKAAEQVAQAQLGLGKDALSMATQSFNAQENRRHDAAMQEQNLAARAEEGRLNRATQMDIAKMNDSTRRYLSRVTISGGGQNDPYVNLIKAGVPTHGDSDIKNYSNILTSKNATKDDKWQARQALLRLGYYKPNDQGIVELKKPGIFGRSYVYAIKKDPNTGLDWLTERIANTGDVKKDWMVVSPMSVKLPNSASSGGRSGTISAREGLLLGED